MTVLYNSLSDGEGNGLSITSVTAVVELPSITRQEAEELVLNTFSGIEDIAGSLVVQSSMVYILKPASESVHSSYMQLCTYSDLLKQ